MNITSTPKAADSANEEAEIDEAAPVGEGDADAPGVSSASAVGFVGDALPVEDEPAEDESDGAAVTGVEDGELDSPGVGVAVGVPDEALVGVSCSPPLTPNPTCELSKSNTEYTFFKNTSPTSH